MTTLPSGGHQQPVHGEVYGKRLFLARGLWPRRPCLTSNDGLLEFNLVNQWQVYENLELNLELGHIVNMMDQDTWQKAGYYGGTGNGSFEKQDAWKARLTFAYSF